MSQKERTRLQMMSRVRDQEMSIREAAKVLNVGYRQCRGEPSIHHTLARGIKQVSRLNSKVIAKES